MSGNSRSGRPAQSAAVHKLRGTYRKNRHGKPGAQLGSGEPVCPRALSGEARKLWNIIVRAYRDRGVLTELDTAHVVSTCELWGLYRAAYDIAKANPTDKLARCAVATYWGLWEKAASRLGLNPSDRQRLHSLAENSAITNDPMHRLLNEINHVAVRPRTFQADQEAG